MRGLSRVHIQVKQKDGERETPVVTSLDSMAGISVDKLFVVDICR
jgi:hypothetical protein